MGATWTVYLLKCADGTYYTGCTSNFEKRLIRHNHGEVQYTKSRLPINVVTRIMYRDKHKAYEFERYLKSGSGIAFRNKRLV